MSTLAQVARLLANNDFLAADPDPDPDQAMCLPTWVPKNTDQASWLADTDDEDAPIAIASKITDRDLTLYIYTAHTDGLHEISSVALDQDLATITAIVDTALATLDALRPAIARL